MVFFPLSKVLSAQDTSAHVGPLKDSILNFLQEKVNGFFFSILEGKGFALLAPRQGGTFQTVRSEAIHGFVYCIEDCFVVDILHFVDETLGIGFVGILMYLAYRETTPPFLLYIQVQIY